MWNEAVKCFVKNDIAFLFMTGKAISFFIKYGVIVCVGR